MSKLINLEYTKFLDALNPLIKTYKIEENETLNVIIHQCFQRLNRTNIDDLNSIEKLIDDLIQVITDGKIGDDKLDVMIDICQRIGVKVKDMQNELIFHKNKIDQHEKKIDELEETIEQLKTTVDSLQSGNETLKDRIDISECFNYAFDLSQLFIFYHIGPVLKKLTEYNSNYGNWTLFKEQLSIIKRKIKEGEQNSSDLQYFVEPLQKELDSLNIAVDVIRLHDLIQNRNSLNHYEKTRSKEEQEDFIDLIGAYEFSNKFIYRDLVQIMINQLKQVTLRRHKK